MAPVKFISGEKVYLRPVEEADYNLVHFGKNNEEVRETLFLFSPLTMQQVTAELKSWIENKETALFTICQNGTDLPVGQTALLRIDYVSRAAIFYIAIYDPAFWSKGFASEATKLVVKYAFDVLNLNRIQLHVSSENTNGIKAYQKAGFKIEGTLRKAMYHHNRYVDFLVMGILREEYYG